MRNNLKVVSLRVNRSFMRNYVYVVGNPLKRTAILLDPAFDHMSIERVLEQNSWTLEAVLTTHHHVDHMDLANYYAQNFQVPIYMSQPEASFYNIGCTNLTCFKPDSLLSLQTADIHILNTPGHTFGASCYLMDNHLFTGDTMFIACLSGCCTHLLSVLSRLTRRLPTWDKMDRSLYQISNEYSRMRVLAMLIFTKLGSLTVSRAPIVVGLGTHTVSKTVQTCCAVEVAGAILD